MVIPKVGEQPSPNTHTTRDPKGKSVLGESSKSANDSQCFKCHVAVKWPSGNLLVWEAGDDEIETIVYEPTDSVTDSDDGVSVYSI